MSDDTAPRPLVRDPAVLDFLRRRRSRPAKTLDDTAPDRAELAGLLAIAARTPDHGKLEPWRFVVIERESMPALATAAMARAEALAMPTPEAEKAAIAFRQGGVIVAVIAAPKPSTKIPDWEQAMSAACVCYGLLNAALAAGWGANWLSGPFARDEVFLSSALNALPGETVAGFVHIGRETAVPPERPRPDVEAITTWL